MAFAGLWDGWKDKATREVLKSCTMLITEPNDFVAEVHDRMPVVLESKDFASWLNDGGAVLLRPAANDVLQRWPVSRREGNANQQSTHRTQGRERVSQALERVRQAARQRKKEKFTALLHHVSVDLLGMGFFALKRDAAPGVDGLTWRTYEADLDRNLTDLHERVHRGAYRALPSRRTYIPKAALGAGSGNRRPSSSWGSPTSADNLDGASSSSNGEPGVIACGQNSRRSRRNCDGGCCARTTSARRRPRAASGVAGGAFSVRRFHA